MLLQSPWYLRLNICFDSFISSAQSAFIPRRSIAENIPLAQEMVMYYYKDGGESRCTIKLDLVKAYDSIEWEFCP